MCFVWCDCSINAWSVHTCGSVESVSAGSGRRSVYSIWAAAGGGFIIAPVSEKKQQQRFVWTEENLAGQAVNPSDGRLFAPCSYLVQEWSEARRDAGMGLNLAQSQSRSRSGSSGRRALIKLQLSLPSVFSSCETGTRRCCVFTTECDRSACVCFDSFHGFLFFLIQILLLKTPKNQLWVMKLSADSCSEGFQAIFKGNPRNDNNRVSWLGQSLEALCATFFQFYS